MTNTRKKSSSAGKKDKGGQSKKTQGRVKNYVVQELVGLAVGVLQAAAAELDASELYVLLAKQYRKLNDELFSKVLERLINDSRIEFNAQNKTFRHKLSKERAGIVMVMAQSLPVVVDNETGERFSIPSDKAGLYLPGDQVLYTLVSVPSYDYGEVERYANVTQVQARTITEIIGEVKKTTRKNGRVDRHFKKMDPRLCNLSIELAESDEVLDRWVGQKVVAVIDRYPNEQSRKVRVHIDRALAVENDSQLEIELAVRQFSLPYRFSDEALAQADALPEKVLAKDRRRHVDLRDVPFCTIDGEDARDFDDAVYAERNCDQWRLLVAIADVSYYVKPDTPLDVDAQTRATSVYFPRRVIPMLPEKLSNGLCSLNPGVDRCSMVCDMMIDELGMVRAYQFYPAVIHSHGRLTYTNVWRYLSRESVPDEKDLPNELYPVLEELYALYKVLRQAREKRGAIDFATRETQVLTDEKGEITGIVARTSNDAHRLIEECMLAANTCAADFIGRNRRMSLYRVHDSPSTERLLQLREVLSGFGLTLGGGSKPTAADYEKVVQAVKDKPYAEAIQLALLRSMQRAVYSPDNIGHYGLGYEAYTHFTSPIRRYPDLLVHRTIKAILAKRTYRPKVYVQATGVLTSYSGQSLERTLQSMPQPAADTPRDPSRGDWVSLGKIASACERRADDASRDVVAWLKCRYMQQIAQNKRRFSARITAVTGFGIFVELLDVFVEGFVHISNLGYDYFDFTPQGTLLGRDFGQTFAVGDLVKVSLLNIDEDKRRIDFRIA